uniref:Uncharacterized protein n=1 Tax=Anguilla anguilla TaxID=7936 RepID=A0A0E9W6E2_ANGAN
MKRFALTNQWFCSVFKRHLLVSPQLAWNLDGGDTRKSTRYQVPSTTSRPMENQKNVE